MAIFIAIWSLLVVWSGWWRLNTLDQSLRTTARIQARAAFEKDVLYRFWNATHGGVYVPVGPNAQPNPYLDHPKREVQTTDGQTLTLINPAYMTRQVHELQREETGLRAHITSLNPLRPANAPDEWEAAALKRLEKGEKEVSQQLQFKNGTWLRLMRPLIARKACLACHAKQGYKEGQVRGGISVSVPMAPLLAGTRHTRNGIWLTHIILWVLGLSLGWLAYQSVVKGIERQKRIERLNLESERLKVAMETAGAASHNLNQPLQVIVTTVEMLQEEAPDDEQYRNALRLIQQSVAQMRAVSEKLRNITRYRTTAYAGKSRILDLDQANGGQAKGKDQSG